MQKIDIFWGEKYKFFDLFFENCNYKNKENVL